MESVMRRTSVIQEISTTTDSLFPLRPVLLFLPAQSCSGLYPYFRVEQESICRQVGVADVTMLCGPGILWGLV